MHELLSWNKNKNICCVSLTNLPSMISHTWNFTIFRGLCLKILTHNTSLHVPPPEVFHLDLTRLTYGASRASWETREVLCKGYQWSGIWTSTAWDAGNFYTNKKRNSTNYETNYDTRPCSCFVMGGLKLQTLQRECKCLTVNKSLPFVRGITGTSFIVLTAQI